MESDINREAEMPGRDRKRAAKRQQILAAAEAAFAAKGFQGAGVAEIAASAGVVPANLYRYFAAKEEMVAAIVQAQRGEVAGLLAAAEAAGPEPMAALLQFLGAVTRQALAPEMRALWLEILAEAARNKRVAALLQADDRQLCAAFAKLLTRAVPAGNAPMLARQLIALMDGAMARAAFDPAFDAEAHLAAMADLLRRGLQ